MVRRNIFTVLEVRVKNRGRKRSEMRHHHCDETSSPRTQTRRKLGPNTSKLVKVTVEHRGSKQSEMKHLHREPEQVESDQKNNTLC